MGMRPHSILVGNCYTDKQGVIRKVDAMDKGQVTFMALQRLPNETYAPATHEPVTVSVDVFAADSEAQVECPKL